MPGKVVELGPELAEKVGELQGAVCLQVATSMNAFRL